MYFFHIIVYYTLFIFDLYENSYSWNRYVGTTLFAAIQSKFKHAQITGLTIKNLINNFKNYSYPTYEKDLKKYFKLKN